MGEGEGTLSTICNEEGGIIDDCIVTNLGDKLYVVINAGHEDKDIPHMRSSIDLYDADIEIIENPGLIALQGPAAVRVMARHSDIDYSSFKFMTGREMTVAGVDAYVTRSGYTGEDGFEIRCQGGDAETLARTLLAESEVAPVGLGARDSLRLEAGLCLYGNDRDDTTTPVEAGLRWTIPKHRRKEGGFVGADVICGQIADKSCHTQKGGTCCERASLEGVTRCLTMMEMRWVSSPQVYLVPLLVGPSLCVISQKDQGWHRRASGDQR